MELVFRSETHISIVDRVQSVGHALCKRLTEILDDSTLRDFNATISYIPIVMPPERAVAYPERSKLNKSRRILDVCPQLNYHIFLDGSDDDIKLEWIRGIESVSDDLIKLGASKEAIKEWDKSLSALKREKVIPTPFPKLSDFLYKHIETDREST